MKLYGHANLKSANTLKLRVALAETGAAYDFVPVDLGKGEQRTPEFLALNPHGKIPVLVDDGFALPESDAILFYIAEKFPAARLIGAGPQQRARALQWCDFASTALYPSYYDLYTHTIYAEPGKRIAAIAESAQQKLERALKVLEQACGSCEWLAVDYSIADIAGASVMRAIQERLEGRVTVGTATAAWFTRVTARPGWQKAAA